MLLSVNKDLNKLLLEITAFQYIGDLNVRTTTMHLAKKDIEYLQDMGVYLPGIVLEELIKELYECDNNKDYENALINFEEKEFNELLSALDDKFKNLNWNEKY